MASNAKVPKLESELLVDEKFLAELDLIQGKLDDIAEQVSNEVTVIEKKYEKKRQPIYHERSKLISQIPNFWLKAMLNHPQLVAVVSEEDEQMLTYLKSLHVDDLCGEGDDTTCKITFTFGENPYFSDSELVKTCILAKATGESDCENTPINWKPGKNPLAKFETVQNGTSGPVKRSYPDCPESFFAWYLGVGEIGSAPTETELFDIFKEDLWSNPLQYYLTLGGEDMDDDEGESDEDVIDADEDDEDNLEDEDDGAEEDPTSGV